MKAATNKLAAALLIIALTCITSPIFTAVSSAQTSGNLQSDFLALVNAERASLGKTPLAANSQLESAAYLHSKDMGDNNYFSHTSQDGTQFSQRITAVGYKWVSAAENIAYAYGAPDATKVYDMWKNSPGHYTNMIGDYVDAGLGVYSINGYTYYTLDLGRSQNPSPTPSQPLLQRPHQAQLPRLIPLLRQLSHRLQHPQQLLRPPQHPQLRPHPHQDQQLPT